MSSGSPSGGRAQVARSGDRRVVTAAVAQGQVRIRERNHSGPGRVHALRTCFKGGEGERQPQGRPSGLAR
jgi:hypothetical protein